MVNGQYIIPETSWNQAPELERERELQQVLAQTPERETPLETQQAEPFLAPPEVRTPTPETHPTPFHFIKEIEDRLDSYRYTAIAIEEVKHPWLKSVKSLVIAPKPLMAEFIEKESKIGGQILQKQDPTHDLRFWSEGHEWFFGWSDGKGVSVANSAVHYQVTDDDIQKSYQGHRVPFTPGEDTYFINAVQAYEHAVRHELYPFDEAFVELTAKDDFGLAA